MVCGLPWPFVAQLLSTLGAVYALTNIPDSDGDSKDDNGLGSVDSSASPAGSQDDTWQPPDQHGTPGRVDNHKDHCASDGAPLSQRGVMKALTRLRQALPTPFDLLSHIRGVNLRSVAPVFNTVETTDTMDPQLLHILEARRAKAEAPAPDSSESASSAAPLLAKDSNLVSMKANFKIPVEVRSTLATDTEEMPSAPRFPDFKTFQQQYKRDTEIILQALAIVANARTELKRSMASGLLSKLVSCQLGLGCPLFDFTAQTLDTLARCLTQGASLTAELASCSKAAQQPGVLDMQRMVGELIKDAQALQTVCKSVEQAFLNTYLRDLQTLSATLDRERRDWEQVMARVKTEPMGTSVFCDQLYALAQALDSHVYCMDEEEAKVKSLKTVGPPACPAPVTALVQSGSSSLLDGTVFIHEANPVRA